MAAGSNRWLKLVGKLGQAAGALPGMVNGLASASQCGLVVAQQGVDQAQLGVFVACPPPPVTWRSCVAPVCETRENACKPSLTTCAVGARAGWPGP